MAHLVEFRVSKTLFDDVKNDLEFRMGFEAEFHVKNASQLLGNDSESPDDFQSFNQFSGGDVYQGAFADYSQYNSDGQDDLEYNRQTVLARVARLLESYMGLQEGSMLVSEAHASTGIADYQQWQLTIDESLSIKQTNPDDIGVELISPVMTLREGLAWANKVFEMISTFQDENISLYTNNLCGFHINLSHIRMGTNFDYAKLAVLSGDEHYLADFKRVSNTYAQPIIQAVRNELTAASQNPETYLWQPKPHAQNALDLLNLKGWSPQRVMQDLAAVIPKEHHMSLDLSRLDSYNPYVEIRIAGNAGYERRFDEIAKMTIRFGALIKIACDPQANREEYLKKIYSLVAGVTTATTPVAMPATTFPKIRIYLRPITDIATRRILDMLENQTRTGAFTNTPFLILRVIKSVIDARGGQDLRIRQGLMMLLESLKLPIGNLQKAANNIQMLKAYGIIGPADKPAPITKALSDFLKWLGGPAGRMPLMQSAPAPEEPKKKKPQMSEHEKRRLEEKKEKMLAEEAERRRIRKLLSEQRQRPRKTPERWVA